jgi:rare lipoprotein A
MRLAVRATRRKTARGALAIAAAAVALLLGACGGAPHRPERAEPPGKPGGYYLDDGPHADPPADLDKVPDAQPRWEPIKTSTARPYTALGRSYTPMTALAPYSETGMASWYGKRYHGQPTASGEIYDMYRMTAAHPTLPIPSYARVTHLASSNTVVVRINDRGPFHADRLIDLSYTAAHRLGMLSEGSARVRVQSILPEQMQPVVARAPPAPPPPPMDSVDSVDGVDSAGGAPVRVQTAPAQGVYLQLGAFASADNAQAFLRRMGTELSWLAGIGAIHHDGRLYRVQAGPYATRDEALDAAGRIDRTLDLKPLIVTR